MPSPFFSLRRLLRPAPGRGGRGLWPARLALLLGPCLQGPCLLVAGLLVAGGLGLSLSAAAQDVVTFHYDNGRSGAQTRETTLTPANVNAASFGKTLSFPVDGDVYAQPLYLAQYTMADGAQHNVLFVATEHDWVYAIDAQGHNPAAGYLWRTSLLGPGETWLAAADVFNTDITPDIGITGTPVIDRAGGTLYVVSKSKSAAGAIQRLHALNLVDGTEKLNGPTAIAATVPGIGDGGTTVSFDPLRQNQRAALLLAPSPAGDGGRSVVIAWGSHGDMTPYHGWVMTYGADDISEQTGVWLNTANGSQGGIWMGAGGPSSDGAGNIFLESGNGTFDVASGGADYGDSTVRLVAAAAGLTVADWFTPTDQLTLNENDIDFGASNPVLLPPQPGAAPHLLLTMGKSGTLYLLNRDHLGGYSSTANADVQEINSGHDSHSNPAFFNNAVYLAGNGGPVQTWSFNPSSGQFNPAPQSQSAVTFGCSQCDGSGSNLSLSANGTTNGVVWAIDYSAFGVGPAVLHAFDAGDLANELYNSNQAANGRDVPAGAVKFTTPVVAGGAVYIGGSNAVTVYGLLGPAGADTTATPAISPSGGSFTAAQTVTLGDATPNAAIYYTTDGTPPTTASTLYSGPLAVASSLALNAMAVAPGLKPSEVATASFAIGPSVNSGVSYASGFSASGMTLNGSAALSGSRLRLTDGGANQAATAFYTTPLRVSGFVTDFSFQLTNPQGEGLTFVIQNAGLNALGPAGSGLGYGAALPGAAPGLGKSVAVKFDFNDNAGEGDDSTGLYVNGASPTVPAVNLASTNVNLRSGDVFQVHAVYDGVTLTLTLSDTVTGAAASQSYKIDIPATVGGANAYVGFSAGTSNRSAVQDILSWTYAPQMGGNEPSFAGSFSAAGMALNNGATVSGGRLHLLDGGLFETRSAYFAQPVDVQSFSTSFSFQFTAPDADGISFILQNTGPHALGGAGGGLGYGDDIPGGTVYLPQSVAVKFDIFSNWGEGTDSTGLYTKGASPTIPAIDLSGSGVNLHSQDVFAVNASYDGSTLLVTIADTATGAAATQSYAVDIPSLVGGSTAYAGFGGGTGYETTSADILSWTYQSPGGGAQSLNPTLRSPRALLPPHTSPRAPRVGRPSTGLRPLATRPPTRSELPLRPVQ